MPLYAIDDQTAIKVKTAPSKSLRGALEAVYPLIPRGSADSLAIFGAASTLAGAADEPLSPALVYG